MSDELRGRTRIITKGGTSYTAAQTIREIRGQPGKEFIEFTHVPAQTAFPPEVTFIRVSEIVSLQTISDEAWVWQQQADALYYAQALQQNPTQRIAEAQEALAEHLRAEGDESP